MDRLIERLNRLAGIKPNGSLVTWLERAAFVFLLLMAAAAPHSIAATQTAWLLGMTAWLLVIIFRRKGREAPIAAMPPSVRWLGGLLWAFFLWSAVSSVMSYEPAVSLDRLRGVALFLIFFFVFYNLRTRRAAAALALTLIASCMVNVLWTPVERLIGRGVEIHGVGAGGPLGKALLRDGDTILEANGQKIRTPEELIAVLERADTSRVKFYRPDFEAIVEAKRSDLLPGPGASERLGISGWSKSHNRRSRGFYGHYTTYAEVLQLIASLVLGLLVGLFTKRWSRDKSARQSDKELNIGVLIPAARRRGIIVSQRTFSFLRSFGPLLVLGFCLAAMCLALLLTVTRASQLAFLVSAFVIVLAAGSRKLFFIAAVVALPVVIGGLVFLQQSRNVGFLDPKDDSTLYRLTMMRDGARLWTESPRNFVFGVGMDSIQRHWHEWGMFDGGRLPMGHFHSMPIQLLAERGLPALILWLAILGSYGWILFKGLKRIDISSTPSLPHSVTPLNRGILLGCLGGMAGFFTSGLVHYNLGDQEVAMVFYLLMGLSVGTATRLDRSSDERLRGAAAIEYRLAA